MGGRFFQGGIVVDILVPTRPLPTPVFIDGEAWHEGMAEPEDLFKRTQLMQEYGYLLADPVVIYGKDLVDDDTAFFAVLEEIGRP